MATQLGTGLSNYLKLAEASLRAGETLRAQKVGREASERGFEHPNLLILAAYEYINARDYGHALAVARRASELAPRNVDALNAWGYCLTLADRYAEALSAFDKALRLAPASAPVHFNKGLALERMGEVAKARRQYARTVDLEPCHAFALGRSAFLAALQGDMGEAAILGRRALAAEPGNVYAALGLSLADIEDGEFKRVIERLQPVAANATFDAITRSLAYGIMADAEDAAGRKAEAFPLYEACGRVLRNAYAPPSGAETALDRAKRLSRYFENTAQQGWRQTDTGSAPVCTHAFMLSFPRSGTTLLEQVLASHPDIETMGERDCLIQSYRFLDSGETLDTFAGFSEVRTHAVSPILLG